MVLNNGLYPSPDAWVVDFETCSLICESETAEAFEEQEEYDDGNGWE